MLNGVKGQNYFIKKIICDKFKHGPIERSVFFSFRKANVAAIIETKTTAFFNAAAGDGNQFILEKHTVCFWCLFEAKEPPFSSEYSSHMP